MLSMLLLLFNPKLFCNIATFINIPSRYIPYIVLLSIIISVIYSFTTSNVEKFGFVEHEVKPLKLTDEYSDFEVIIGDKLYGDVLKIKLRDLFAFIDNFQVNDMDPRQKLNGQSCHRRDESIIVQNAIREMLKNLRFIIYSNNKDNFYHRFLVSKIGPNLQNYMDHTKRKLNFDEMVRDRIGKQFTFIEKNEYDKYYPRPNLDSYHQSPLPTNINVHNYYTYENIEVNLLALKAIIDLCQNGNHNDFGLIVRPTEHMIFEEEFMVPIRSITNSILTIVNTNKYKEYIFSYKL